MTTTTLADSFTLAPTVNATVKTSRYNPKAAKVDEIQNAFNLHLFRSVNRIDILPLSDALFNLFCAYEMGAEEADEMLLDLIHACDANICHYESGVQDLRNALADLDETTAEQDDSTIDVTPMGGW